MGKFNLLIITHAYRWKRGGIQTIIENVIGNLPSEININLLTEQYSFDDRNDVNFIPTPFSLGRPNSKAEFLNGIDLINEVIDKIEPDAILASDAGLCSYFNFIKPEYKLYSYIHGNDIYKPWQLTPGFNTGQLIQDGLNKCKRLFCLSEFVKNKAELSGITTEKSISPPGVNKSRLELNKTNSRIYINNKFHIPVDKTLILTVARVVARKGHSNITKALLSLTADFQWIIVGENKDKSILEEIKGSLEKRVSIIGLVDAKDLALIYSACDLFVMFPTSLENETDIEGFGLVYLEAASYGILPIGSDAGGSSEALEKWCGGIVLPENDLEALIQVFREVLENRESLLQRGFECEKRISRLNGWKMHTEYLIEIISQN